MKSQADIGQGIFGAKGARRLVGVASASVLGAAALVACGGGGGGSAGSSGTSGTTETPNSVPQVELVIDAVPSGTNAFHAAVDERWADPGFVEGLVGGPTRGGWNMADPQQTMTPGMKIAFFGRSPECISEVSDGPLVAGSGTDFSTAVSRSGIAVDAASTATRWTPSANVAACASLKDRTGPNWIYFNPSASSGGMAVYTTVGPDSAGQQPFLRATGPQGTDGNGYNANGIANFVAFRHKWYADDAVRPWRDKSGATVDARILARQTVGAMEVGPTKTGVISQVKQQVMFTVINTTCQRLSQAGSPCHVQYLFNTAAARAGVTDWESWSPSHSAHIWFDKDQGTLPIVDGQVPAAGESASETDYQNPLYQSAGYATQHQAFNDLSFDIRIRFDQLLTVVRLMTARRLSVTPDAVTDEQIAAMWGPDWNSTDKWTLISTTFGQEVHNSEFTTRRSWIGGGFSEIYAGPVR